MEGILGIDDRSCRPAISRPETFGHDPANSRILTFRDAYWSPHSFARCCPPGTFFHQVDFVQAVRIDVFWMGQSTTV